jgi:hypothetical protein
MNDYFYQRELPRGDRKQIENREDRQRIESPSGAEESKLIASELKTEN